MRAQLRAISNYGAIRVSTGVASADSVQLIQMLFDGLVESLATAKGHLLRGAVKEKSDQLARASRIVLGLQGALDFERGGDLARNLDELYRYCTRRLLHANAHNDVEALEEVLGLMSDIRDAWQTLPALLRETAPRLALSN